MSEPQAADFVQAEGRLALLLAGVAGLVDAIGYLSLFRLYTAHMSGNSVAVGLNLGRGLWAEAARFVIPIPPFVLGVAVTALLMEAVRRRGGRRVTAAALGLEALMLVGFTLYGSAFLRGRVLAVNSGPPYDLLVALLAGAMGVQTAALQRVGQQIVRTTFITSALASLASAGATHLLWLWDHRQGWAVAAIGRTLRASLTHPALSRAGLNAGIWLCYIFGAVLGGYGELHWLLKAMAFPIAGLGAAIVADLRRPFQPAAAGET